MNTELKEYVVVTTESGSYKLCMSYCKPLNTDKGRSTLGNFSSTEEAFEYARKNGYQNITGCLNC